LPKNEEPIGKLVPRIGKSPEKDHDETRACCNPLDSLAHAIHCGEAVFNRRNQPHPSPGSEDDSFGQSISSGKIASVILNSVKVGSSSTFDVYKLNVIYSILSSF
jgi:hypothetical protein